MATDYMGKHAYEKQVHNDTIEMSKRINNAVTAKTELYNENRVRQPRTSTSPMKIGVCRFVYGYVFSG